MINLMTCLLRAKTHSVGTCAGDTHESLDEHLCMCQVHDWPAYNASLRRVPVSCGSWGSVPQASTWCMREAWRPRRSMRPTSDGGGCDTVGFSPWLGPSSMWACRRGNSDPSHLRGR